MGASAGRVAGRVAASGLCLVLSAGWALARCERGDYTANPPKNTRSEVRMLASSGKECVIRLSAGRRIQVLDRRITIVPANGKATIEGETVFYRSFPGYTGPDSFTAEIAGRSADGEGVASVTVKVTVED
jgi:hypothetical protein